MKVILKNARLGFPALWEPKAMDADSKPRYGAALIIPPDHPQVDELNNAIDKVGAEKWGVKGAATVKALRQADKVCLHDGNLKADYDGFEGNLYVSAASPGDGPAPTVVDRARNRVGKADGIVYAGCYVNAVIDVWAQDNGFGKRVNASLSGIQFVRDGDAFGGSRPAAPDDFEALDDEEGGDDPLV